MPISDGITCIAGPNGCGKSNIIDAVRWALGEQSNKSLRAGAMAEVIFAGTQDLGPSSMAEVTLEFVRDKGPFPETMDGFDEISISRRLFSTGDSAYSLNGLRCRLKDITDLFIDTGLDRHGYAIVEQGKVKDIIQARPEEIRYLIEEAAEVGKFRIRRLDAIKRLEATAVNLERIMDLLNEVSRQRDDLKSQANKARRYQSVRDEINELTRLLWSHEIRSISVKQARLIQERQEIENRIVVFQKQGEEYENALKSCESRLGSLRQKMNETAKELGEARSRQLIAEKEIETVGKREQDISSTYDMLKDRIAQMGISHEEFLAKKSQEENELEILLLEISHISGEINSRSEQGEALRRQYEVIEGEYNRKRTGLFSMIGNQKAVEQRISSLEARKQEVVANTLKRKGDLAELSVLRMALQEKLDDLDASTLEKRSEKEALDVEIQGLEKKIRDSHSEIEEMTHHLVGLEKNHAQIVAKITMLDRIIAAGTRPIPPDLGRQNGTKRVGDAVRVKAGYETTVGRSMGSSLDYLIIQDHDEILQFPSIDAGGPGYIPKRPHVGDRGAGKTPWGDGVIAPLREFLDAHDGYEDVIEVLSQDMLVVEDINSAVALWNQGMRSCSLVTRDGTILEPSGVVRTTADMEKYAEGLKARAEKEEISGHLVSIGEQIADSKDRLFLLRQGAQELKLGLESAQGRDRALRKEFDVLLEKRHGDAREMERLDEREQSFVRDIGMWEGMLSRLSEDLAAIMSEKTLLDDGIGRMQEEIRELETGRVSAKQALDQVQGAIGSHSARKSEIEVNAASKHERLQGIEVERLSSEIGRDVSKIEELQNTKDAVVWALEKARTDLATAGEDAVRLEGIMSGLAPEYEDLSDRFTSMMQDRDECRERIAGLEKEKNEISLQDREQEIALAMSMERFRSRFAQEDLPDVPEGFNPDEARDKTGSLEARIEKMGQINFASLEAYEQVQARWDDLHRQYEDVVQASTRLREVIENIEKQSMKAFMSTFEQIRINFQELFSTMFGGGKADIVLTEGNPMDAGVEILACPPFKKLKSMSLLSEGEKTLCALSFVFALFKVRPSPFCILDEVDAPLDDANVIRFNRLIHSFSTDSQFIMVTHNRHTMEMADILYGVTFDAPGVSKVVSMVLQDV